MSGSELEPCFTSEYPTHYLLDYGDITCSLNDLYTLMFKINYFLAMEYKIILCNMRLLDARYIGS